MSQSFLDAFLPLIASAFDAVARNPGRDSPTWHRLVGRGLPMGDAEIQALERSVDAMLDVQIHRIVHIPGAWCAFG